MDRKLATALDVWARSPMRKPLVLRGARQVGKSWLVRSWGERRYGSVVALDLERDPKLARLFRDNDPAATLRRLEAYTGHVIRPDGTCLLFIDEIQAAPELLAKMRWFFEELPKLPLVAAGSLLDFALAEHSFSMPVGRIGYLNLDPMGFEEFLGALGERKLLTWFESLTLAQLRRASRVESPLHEKALGLFRVYLLVGGMPEAVAHFQAARSLAGVGQVHRDLLATFRDDFAKYADRVHHRRLTEVFDSVPEQIGSKFRYASVDRSERPPALAKAVDLLCLARVCHRVRASPARRVPVAAGADERFFKLVFLDVGLVSTALGLTLEDLESADITLAHEGALAEQVAGQLLRLTFPPSQEPVLHYWHRDQKGSEAEVDYVLQHGSRLLPIEVKAGRTGTLKSLHLLMASREWPLALRLNADFPSLSKATARTHDGKVAAFDLLSLPLYLTEQVPRLLDAWR